MTARTVLRAMVLALVVGCAPDSSPIKEENERLREQVAKQESVISSLQEGNAFLQQQSTLMSRDLKEAKKEAERVESERKALAASLEAQLKENRKLASESRRTAVRHFEEKFQVDEKDGQTQEMSQPLAAVCKAAEEALARNGYALRVNLRLEQRAAYVTERKVSAPSSLEVTGFRNQYLVSLHALPSKGTRLHVKADFEKMGQDGRVLTTGPEETAEIERRLIAEIAKALAQPGKA